MRRSGAGYFYAYMEVGKGREQGAEALARKKLLAHMGPYQHIRLRFVRETPTNPKIMTTQAEQATEYPGGEDFGDAIAGTKTSILVCWVLCDLQTQCKAGKPTL